MGGGAPPGARASRPHPLRWVAAPFPRDAAPGHPAGGNRIGPAEAESWRRCRSSPGRGDGRGCASVVRARRSRSRPSSRDGVAAKQVHRYSCPFVFIRGSSLLTIGCFTEDTRSGTALPHWQGQCLLVKQEGGEEAPLRERGRLARMHCVGWPLRFPVMRHTATLPPGTPWARLKRNRGAVAGRAGWRRGARLCQCCAGETPALPAFIP